MTAPFVMLMCSPQVLQLIEGVTVGACMLPSQCQRGGFAGSRLSGIVHAFAHSSLR
jgi:hypothetical protein